jgi:hypothetical protein
VSKRFLTRAVLDGKIIGPDNLILETTGIFDHTHYPGSRQPEVGLFGYYALP